MDLRCRSWPRRERRETPGYWRRSHSRISETHSSFAWAVVFCLCSCVVVARIQKWPSMGFPDLVRRQWHGSNVVGPSHSLADDLVQLISPLSRSFPDPETARSTGPCAALLSIPSQTPACSDTHFQTAAILLESGFDVKDFELESNMTSEEARPHHSASSHARRTHQTWWCCPPQAESRTVMSSQQTHRQT